MDGDKTDTLPTWGKTLCGEIFVCFFVLFSDNALGKADVWMLVLKQSMESQPAATVEVLMKSQSVCAFDWNFRR